MLVRSAEPVAGRADMTDAPQHCIGPTQIGHPPRPPLTNPRYPNRPDEQGPHGCGGLADNLHASSTAWSLTSHLKPVMLSTSYSSSSSSLPSTSMMSSSLSRDIAGVAGLDSFSVDAERSGESSSLSSVDLQLTSLRPRYGFASAPPFSLHSGSHVMLIALGAGHRLSLACVYDTDRMHMQRLYGPK